MPQNGALRDAIHQRLAAGETQRQAAVALGISRWELWHVLQTPEEPEPDEEPDEESEPDTPPDLEPALPLPPPALEPVTASEALTWLQEYAERVESQAQEAYAPWHTLAVVQELSTLVVAVIKELRAKEEPCPP